MSYGQSTTNYGNSVSFALVILHHCTKQIIIVEYIFKNHVYKLFLNVTKESVKWAAVFKQIPFKSVLSLLDGEINLAMRFIRSVECSGGTIPRPRHIRPLGRRSKRHCHTTPHGNSNSRYTSLLLFKDSSLLGLPTAQRTPLNLDSQTRDEKSNATVFTIQHSKSQAASSLGAPPSSPRSHAGTEVLQRHRAYHPDAEDIQEGVGKR